MTKNLLILLLVLMSPLFLSACTRQQYFFAGQIVFDGSIPMTVQLNTNGDYRAAAQAMFDLGQEINVSASTSYVGGIIYNFNNSDSTDWIEIDGHVFVMMQAVLYYYSLVEGFFNPTIISPLPDRAEASIAGWWNVDITGINRYGWPRLQAPFQPDRLPTPGEIDQYFLHIPLTDLIHVKQNESQYFMRKSYSHIKIDLGGIAKGYLADLSVEIAKRHGIASGIINVSGDLTVFGNRDWSIGIVDPRPRATLFRDQEVIALRTNSMGLVTSGDYQRFFVFDYTPNVINNDDVVYVQHTIDPRAGIPAGLEWRNNRWHSKVWVSSVTVLHPSAMVSEILSTAIMAAGLDVGVRLVNAVALASAIIFEDSPNARDTGHRMAVVGSVDVLDSRTGYRRYQMISGD